MILYLDKDWCVTTRDKAVDVLFGVPDWVAEDIKEYQTRYCCSYEWRAAVAYGWGVVSFVRCSGMGGAREFSVDAFPCVDGDRRAFVLNRDSVIGRRRPFVCSRKHGLKFRYVDLVDKYGDMVKVAERARCRSCVVDEYGRVVVFGSDLFEVIDKWVVLMRRKVVTPISVLV
jgi:hypothetical protein